ncbi:MAG: diadenylate cyclase [Myxococcaceae bacterium]|nr:diadenylate cyclase [Myxococcaceae bacterium]
MDDQSQYLYEYQLIADGNARRVFSLLDPSFEASVRLILLSNGEQVFVQELIPDVGDFSEDELAALAEELSTLRNNGPKPEWDKMRGVLLTRLQEKYISQKFLAITSPAIPVADGMLFIVTLLSAHALGPVELLRDKDAEPVPVEFPKTLPYATLLQFIQQCVSDFHRRISLQESVLMPRDPNELIRSGGRLLMWRAILQAKPGTGEMALFDDCDALATVTYERKGLHSRLVLCRPDDSRLKYRYRLAQPVELSSRRAARKILETAKESDFCVTDAHLLYGLADIDWDQRKADPALYFVEFEGGAHWTFRRKDLDLMRVDAGRPTMPRAPLSVQQFIYDLRRRLPDIEPEVLKELFFHASLASRSGVGTIILISEGAIAEAKRLRSQSTPIVPSKIDSSVLSRLARIDGAILFDSHGVCHAFGVILDGSAKEGLGDPSRGSRFNSAVRYVESSEFNCMAVVISDDGIVNIIPEMPSVISRRALTQRIEQLSQLAHQESPSLMLFSRVIEWLDRRRFYLDQEACDVVNYCVAEINKRLEEAFRRNVEAFEPTPELDETYFVD